MIFFEWDEQKAKSNERKHGITFDESSTVFADLMSLTIHDPLHSDDEDRFIIIGNSCGNRILTIVYTDRANDIRLISARKATKAERLYYEDNER